MTPFVLVLEDTRAVLAEAFLFPETKSKFCKYFEYLYRNTEAFCHKLGNLAQSAKKTWDAWISKTSIFF